MCLYCFLKLPFIVPLKWVLSKDHPLKVLQFLITISLSVLRIFVNRSLHLENIKFYGFDMDYTLAGEYGAECRLVTIYQQVNCLYVKQETKFENRKHLVVCMSSIVDMHSRITLKHIEMWKSCYGISWAAAGLCRLAKSRSKFGLPLQRLPTRIPWEIVE